MVSATDTDAGKTYVTALLARYMHERGYQVTTQKWVQTGCDAGDSDLTIHDLGMSRTGMPDAWRQPYRFRFPASPHLAAAMEDSGIEPKIIKHAFKTACDAYVHVLVEGAGGLMVPLNAETRLIDLIAELELPTLLVVPNRLGTINQALLSLSALQLSGIPILGFVMNQCSPDISPAILADNPDSISRFSEVPCLGVLSYEPDPELAYRQFESVGAAIVGRL